LTIKTERICCFKLGVFRNKRRDSSWVKTAAGFILLWSILKLVSSRLKQLLVQAAKNGNDNQEFGILPSLNSLMEISTSYQKLRLTKFLKPSQASQVNSTQRKNMIIILDTTNEFVKKNYDNVATLFIQELLCLHYQNFFFVKHLLIPWEVNKLNDISFKWAKPLNLMNKSKKFCLTS